MSPYFNKSVIVTHLPSDVALRVCAGAVGSLHPPCAAAASPLARSCATQTSTASTGPARCGRRWQPPSLTEQEASTGSVEVQIGRGDKFEWRLVIQWYGTGGPPRGPPRAWALGAAPLGARTGAPQARCGSGNGAASRVRPCLDAAVDS